MRLRKLELKDAPLMLEWMHDDSVVRDLKTNFAAKTIEDCKSFIICAAEDRLNRHLAIVDDADEYMGTVSLKHIESGAAEFGITIRTCAMGKGYSHFGMEQILKYGFAELGLKLVYWCVAPQNQRAVRFYDKHGFPRRQEVSMLAYGYSDDEKKEYIWYYIKPEMADFLSNNNLV